MTVEDRPDAPAAHRDRGVGSPAPTRTSPPTPARSGRGGFEHFSGAQLRTLRERRGWGVKELAARVGARASAIVEYEYERRKPETRRARALAEALGVPVRDLADHSGRAEWPLAALRRACGLDQREVSRSLGIALVAYRRMELCGHSPNPKSWPVLADIFRVDCGTLDTAVSNIPATRARHAEARAALDALWAACLRPGRTTPPSSTEAAELIRAFRGCCREDVLLAAVRTEFDAERRRRLGEATLRARLDWAALPPHNRQTAQEQLDASARAGRSRLESLPATLDGYLRWRAHTDGTLPRAYGRWATAR